MKRFKNILVVFESDPSTLHRAALLAKDNHGRLTLMQVIKESQDTPRSIRVGDRDVNVRKLLLTELQHHLKSAAQSLHEYGVRPATQVCFGDPSREVICDVIQKKRDLVIMTAESKGGLRERLFGGTSSHLIRKCPVPLLITKPSERLEFKKILAAIDPGTSDNSHDSLNSQILELSQSMAHMEQAELHIVHAWSIIGESILRGHSEMLGSEIDQFVLNEMNRRRGELTNLLHKHGLPTAKLHLVNGDPTEAVPKVVAKVKPDLLIMGTVCRTGIPGFIIGNTAERVLGAVQCSVLVVKPAGFVSPVVP